MRLSDMDRVALARFISWTGSEAAFFVGIWGKASFEFNATPPKLALVMAALGIASLVGSIWSGLLVDRLGPRRVLILGELAFMPAVLSLILARNITEFALLVFFTGLLSTPIYTAVASMAPFSDRRSRSASDDQQPNRDRNLGGFRPRTGIGGPAGEAGQPRFDLRA